MKLGKRGKRALIIGSALLLVLCIACMLLLKPQGILYRPQLENQAVAHSAGTVVDLGAIQQVKEILWNGRDSFVSICGKDDGYLWIFEGSVTKQTGEQRSILNLKEKESYCSAVFLDDGTMAVVTTKRLIYLNEKLAERRSVMLREMDRFSEAVLSRDGGTLAYINSDGLRLRSLKANKDVLAVPVHLQGEGTVPLLPRWLDEANLGYRYTQEGGRMTCGLVKTDGSGQQLFGDCGLFASFGSQYMGMESPDGPDAFYLITMATGRSTCYELEDNILCAMAQNSDMLCAVTLSQSDGVTYFNRLDFATGALSTIYAISTGEGSINGKTAALSAEGKLAVAMYPVQESNAKILVVDLLHNSLGNG